MVQHMAQIRILDEGKPRTVLVDFDGVIHDYTRGWTGPYPEGRLLHGVDRALVNLKDAGARVEIYSTRPAARILEFLESNHVAHLVDDVRDGKPYYVAFFDDRAWHVRPSSRYGLLRSVDRWLDVYARSR